MSLHDPLTYSYQSQLVTWLVVAQNYVKSCVPSIIEKQQSLVIKPIVA